MDLIFRALADPSRRRMLDLLKARPGLAVGELCPHFEFSRYAVMKHLRVLKEASLVTGMREGRTKRLHLNAIPIQMIHDRWISQYSALWASQLTALKYQLESEDAMMTAQELKHVFVLYIRTTQDRLWDALTNPEVTQKYYFGTRLRTDLKIGGAWEYVMTGPDGMEQLPVKGVIEDIIPKTRIVHSFNFHDKSQSNSRVTYQLEPANQLMKLTVTHDRLGSDEETYNSVSNGWPVIFNGLKTLLETGEPLDFGGKVVE